MGHIVSKHKQKPIITIPEISETQLQGELCDYQIILSPKSSHKVSYRKVLYEIKHKIPLIVHLSHLEDVIMKQHIIYNILYKISLTYEIEHYFKIKYCNIHFNIVNDEIKDFKPYLRYINVCKDINFDD